MPKDAPPSVDHVIVLIAAPGKAELSDDLLAEVAATVAMFNPELRWLRKEGRLAAEMAFTPPPPSHFNPRSLQSRLAGRLMGRAIDIAVLPLGGRRKRLVITDMPADAPGAAALAATMRAHGGAALFGIDTPPADMPPAREVLAAVHDDAALPLFDAAGLTVAWHATGQAAGQADARIIHNDDLATLLYLQGYRHADFIEH